MKLVRHVYFIQKGKIHINKQLHNVVSIHIDLGHIVHCCGTLSVLHYLTEFPNSATSLSNAMIFSLGQTPNDLSTAIFNCPFIMPETVLISNMYGTMTFCNNFEHLCSSKTISSQLAKTFMSHKCF